MSYHQCVRTGAQHGRTKITCRAFREFLLHVLCGHKEYIPLRQIYPKVLAQIGRVIAIQHSHITLIEADEGFCLRRVCLQERLHLTLKETEADRIQLLINCKLIVNCLLLLL
jgi:hypothetical protein